jgi:hypothetical protein
MLFLSVLSRTHSAFGNVQWLAELASHFYEWKGKPMPKS